MNQNARPACWKIVCFCLALAVAGTTARHATAAHISGIEPEVFVNGQEIGFLDIRVVPLPDGDEGLFGFFRVEAQNPDGTGMSIAQLEKFLGQDHLNWFQKVVKDTNPGKDANGNQLKVPYIDPPNDGTATLWADEIPWYFDEQRPGAGEVKPGQEFAPDLLLERNVRDNILLYHDGPTGEAGDVVDFVTFLVSDYGVRTYSVLAGFSWGFRAEGGQQNDRTHITSLEAGAPFTNEYAREIFDEFGWQVVPEPPTWLLSLVGTAPLIVMGRLRRSLVG